MLPQIAGSFMITLQSECVIPPLHNLVIHLYKPTGGYNLPRKQAQHIHLSGIKERSKHCNVVLYAVVKILPKTSLRSQGAHHDTHQKGKLHIFNT